ncbi:MAG: 3-dehydroquinate synthase, partial [Pseudomonadota bacterium]
MSDPVHSSPNGEGRQAASTVPVALGDRSYDIHIGPDLLANAPSLIAPYLARSQTAIVTDETVAGLHGQSLQARFEAAGITAPMIAVPAGEASKDLATLGRVSDGLLAAGVERRDTILALGGGVIGDLAGFAAAVLRRGVDFIQVPTTLLAQVDSSVGGKTGVNSSHGKNLIGAFHQPKVVLADTNVLASLPPRELRAGYAEVVKYGLIDDAAFFAWLEQNGRSVLALEPAALTHAIETSCRAKARIVAADEREAGQRALLNLGHTFGHALEAEMGYTGALLHGEAVAIGMAMAFRFSARLGHVSGPDATRVTAHLEAMGLPTHLSFLQERARG